LFALEVWGRDQQEDKTQENGVWCMLGAFASWRH